MKIEKFSNLIYSIGAAIVIFGAWAKIIHKPFADTMLTVGLITEAVLFVYMGITDYFKHKTVMTELQTMDNLLPNARLVGKEQNNDELTSAVNRLNDTVSKIFKTA